MIHITSDSSNILKLFKIVSYLQNLTLRKYLILQNSSIDWVQFEWAENSKEHIF